MVEHIIHMYRCMHAILLLILLIPSVESVKWLEMWEPVPFLEGLWKQTISELLDSTMDASGFGIS